MKTILVFLTAAIPAFGFCQLPANVSKKEHKQAIQFIRKKLPPDYRKIPMVLMEHASRQLDSMDEKGIRSMVRFYEFKNSNISDAAIELQVCTNGSGIKPMDYIYYSIDKSTENLMICVVSGQ
jgi:hypothetical protein